MRFYIRFSLLFLVVLLNGCAPTGVTIKTLKGNNIDFSNYHTYYLLPEPPKDDGTTQQVKSFPRTVVERAVQRELNNRNYTEVKDENQADVLVAIQFSLQDEERTYNVNGYNSGSYYGGHHGYRGHHGYGGHHGYYGHGYHYRNYYGYRTFSNGSPVVARYRKVNMVIDIIDRKEHALIWEAFAEGEGETEMDAIEAKVNRVVAEIFTRYPYPPAVGNSGL